MPGRAQHRAFAFDGDVGAFGKDGVEVRAEDRRCGPRLALRAALLAEHVALLVDAHVREPALLEHLRVELRALGFLERRRLHLAEPNLILERLRSRPRAPLRPPL